MELLVNGKISFERIIEEIKKAKESIEIQMFIWRDDVIGNILLNHLIDAANKGIKITIKKDLYGAIFEKGEETRQSLFHKKTPFKVSFISWIIGNIAYRYKESPSNSKQKENKKIQTLLNHPNVTTSLELIKDHTKYYIFDNETLIMGGINIEDKEYEKDLQNRHYQDYMVFYKNKEEVSYFLERLNQTKEYDPTRKIDYILNTKNKKEAEPILLEMINNATKTIDMAMAYFGNKKIIKALIKGQRRGIEINIVSSNKSNIQPHLNKKVFKKLSKNNIKIYLHNGLIHAKALLIDDKLTIGSINLNDSGLKKLSECSLTTTDKTLIKAYHKDFIRLKNESKITLTKNFKYSRFMAFFEKIYS